jgi:multiple sugar transport system substrate-binding protein
MRKHLVMGMAVAVTAALALSGCTASGGSEDDDTLTIWTVEDVAERVAAQQAIVDAYSEESGVTVKLVPLAEDDLATVLASSAAAGDLPDAVGAVPLPGINQMSSDGLLDTDAAGAIVDSLGTDTFSPRSLELTQAGGAQLAVPSDGFAQLLYYRTDLFAAAGLDVPDTYDNIRKAADKLNGDGMAGIVASTTPADSFTQQTFEHFALANDCQLTNDAGDITLDSPECIEALDYYAGLISADSTAGNQDADTTRAAYFAGQAAMVVWSSFLLDELAGLRNDALPTCTECAADAGFLAANTGVVSAIEGPDSSEPSSFGEVVSWGILADASPKTQDFVKYMMNEGYTDWLAVSPEGKVPTRHGTADEPTKFTDAWSQLEAGVDTKALLSDVYSPEILEAVVAAPDSFNRWGIPQRQGALAGAVSGQFIIPQVLSEMLNSGLSADDAAKKAQEQAETVKSDLG